MTIDLDNPTIPTCPKCGALPELHSGVVASVRFTADGNATITIDLSDLADGVADGDWSFACPDDCGIGDDAEAWAEASHDLEPIVLDIAVNCAPSLDYTIGSGANRA